MNYFNYFTEIEEHFQAARGTGTFLFSPLDWALIETWKDAGVPLDAALKGVDRAFEKWHKRKRRVRMVNSLAYCAQEVLAAAREAAEGEGGGERRTPEPAFEPKELARYFRDNAGELRRAAAAYEPTAQSLDKLAAAADDDALDDMEAVEQRLGVLEQRLIAAAVAAMSEDELLDARRKMEAQLAPYRSKMNVEQLARLEKQYLERAALEEAGLPRLSLFYFRP